MKFVGEGNSEFRVSYINREIYEINRFCSSLPRINRFDPDFFLRSDYVLKFRIFWSVLVRASEIETRVRVQAPGDGFGAKPRFFWRRRRDFPP